MPERPSVAYQKIENLIVLVHGDTSVRDEDWEPYANFLHDHRAYADSGQRVLVVSPGGHGPNAKQRNLISAQLKQAIPTAVLTNSRTARGIVTALSWFNSAIRAFAVDDFSAALAYLGIPAGQREQVQEMVARLRQQVG